MGVVKFGLVAILLLGLAFSLGCAKKVISSEAVGYTPTRPEPKTAEARPEAKPEATSPESTAALEREKKLREETLREEALRQKALQEEAARREALAREAALKATKLESVYFDFDQWGIREDQKKIMIKNSEWMKANPDVKIRLEGHCDERGTAEYNLALGQKRAEAAKTFLEGLGITGQRLSTLSYGEERPLDPGHNEEAWAKNRRVDFIPVR